MSPQATSSPQSPHTTRAKNATMTHLLPPHGGVPEPVCRTVPADEVESFGAEAKKLPKVPVSQADLSTVYRIADGTLSPLSGPMNHEVYNRVLDESVIEHNGRLF